MENKSEFEKALEIETGESMASLRDMMIDDRRKMNEKKFKHAMEFVSFDKFIGRGNVLLDRTISHADVDKKLEDAIR